MMDKATQAVFERVLVRPAGDGLALVNWRGAVGAGRVVQLYVNGRLHDVVRPVGEVGEYWLFAAEAGRTLRVELLAAPARRAWADYSHLLAGESVIAAKARVALVRDEALAVDSRVFVEVDGEVADERPLWGALDSRSGFGGLFGMDAFGVSTATAEGHGRGEFGVGAFGAGGRAWRWEREPAAGEHALTVRVVDGAGRALAEPVEETVTVERLPAAAERVAVEDGVLVWA